MPEYARIQKDDNAGINLFAYCCNDAVNNVDTNGYWKKNHHYNWTLIWLKSWVKNKKIFSNLKKYYIDIPKYCKKLDEEYPSTYYAGHMKEKNTKSWQYFHFNGNATGTDSRVEYADDMLENAVNSWKYSKQKSLMYLGYGLHAIQDIQAHGQIGRGWEIPVHGATADDENYVWSDSSHKRLRLKRKNDQSRKTSTYYASLNYLIRFLQQIGGNL